MKTPLSEQARLSDSSTKASSNAKSKASSHSSSGSSQPEPTPTKAHSGIKDAKGKPVSTRLKTPKKLDPIYVRFSRVVVENKYFVGFTTLLTVYALTGDDVRLIATNKPADMFFNYVVILCILVFTVEVVISCLGKDDYFMGFFFVLDVLSTSTLILDLTFVADILAGGGEDEDQAKNAKAGRTARIGAKAGRVVRVLRLVRILKLYKALYDAKKEEGGRLTEAARRDE